MGLVQQAVLEFDEEIQAPWRPRLVTVAGANGSTRPRRPHPSGRSSSRVGACRPPDAVRDVSGRRAAAESDMRHATGEHGVRPDRSRGAVSARRATGRRVRLTRRARRLAVVLVLALGVAIGSWLGPLLAGGEGDLRLAGVQSVVVQPGDTLWSIAADAAGTADVRAVVDRIQELNGLQGTVLMPGQVLELP